MKKKITSKKKTALNNKGVNLYNYLNNFKEESDVLFQKVHQIAKSFMESKIELLTHNKTVEGRFANKQISDHYFNINLPYQIKAEDITREHLKTAYADFIPYDITEKFTFLDNGKKSVVSLMDYWLERVFIIYIKNKYFKDGKEYLIKELGKLYTVHEYEYHIDLYKDYLFFATLNICSSEDDDTDLWTPSYERQRKVEATAEAVAKTLEILFKR